MPRSLKKGPYVDERILKKIKNRRPGDRTPVKTWSSAATITPDMVGVMFHVHNGRDFIPVPVTEDMVGHKLGEFAPTRKFVRHGGRMAKEEETKAAAAAAASQAAVKTEERK
jgi:small subunit ribosomal protein S19